MSGELLVSEYAVADPAFSYVPELIEINEKLKLFKLELILLRNLNFLG